MSECICEFPKGCGGDGFIYCEGCGGDICVCAACFANGQIECYGCEDCADPEDSERDTLASLGMCEADFR